MKRALLDATGAAEPDPSQIASAFHLLCIRLRERLQPLFGTLAVTALFARAHRAAALEFPWLPEIVVTADDGCAADVGASGRELPQDHLEEGLAALLAHNIGLLATFVGEDLVWPIVKEAWGTAMLADDQPGPKVMND